jgi:proteasome accessory factor C
MTRPSAIERLSRLLAVVPWVVAHDGPTVEEVCQRFDISERELIADLNLLFMCGVYPYTPDSLIEVDLEGGRVWVRFADWFRRPLRLSAPEGLALVAGARAMLEVPGVPVDGRPGGDEETANPGAHLPSPPEKPGDALASAVAKLEMVLGAGGGEPLDIELGAASEQVLATLQAGVTERRKVLVDYYSFGRDESGQRVVHPWRVFSSEGHWYLAAWCENAKDQRMFRVDRVRSAVLLEATFPAPEYRGPVPTYESRVEDPLVVLDLAPRARWVSEHYPNEGITDLGGGHVRVHLRASSTAWLERLLLRAGPDATVVSGADGVAAAAAKRVLAVYGPGTSDR